MVVETADLVEVGYIVEAGHIAGIEEKMGIAEDTRQEKMFGIAVVGQEIFGLVLLAGAGNSDPCRLARSRRLEYTKR